MSLLLTNAFEDIKRRYLEVIEQTPGMAEYTRWKYGQHPSDEMLQGYINRGEMYVYTEEETVKGMVAITMYQGEDYEDVSWGRMLQKDEVAVLHILAVCPAYQKQGIAEKMIREAINLAAEHNKKAVRLDSLGSNIPAQKMYEKLGFVYRGKLQLYAENTGLTDFKFYEWSFE